ncbi:MAG TPA: hypothetical protein VGB73_13745 [Pyrinomonadaceae bacterium]|jgi:hypothetical protein
MYCSSCGVAVGQGLSYCNHCGAKLNGEKGESVVKSSEIKPEALVQGIMAVFVCGLGAIAVLLGVMKAVLDFDMPVLVAFALLSFLIMIVIEGVFIRLLLRRKRSAEGAGNTLLSKGQATKELEAAQARALPEPVPSVTEGTTRAFEPAYRERQHR